MSKRPRVVWAAVVTVAVALGAAGFTEPAPAGRSQAPDEGAIHVLPVQDNVYMLVGTGGNITVQLGSDGVLLVDTLDAQSADPLLRTIGELSDKAIRHIINTHVHADHTGGNERLAAAGQALAQPGGIASELIDPTMLAEAGDVAPRRRAQVIAHWNVLNRMIEDDTPAGRWPGTTFLTSTKDIFFNGEGIQVLHQPAAHTDGDVIVFFRRSDVISTGDIYVTTSYPVIDLDRGGSINGIIDALNRVLELTIPDTNQEGGTMVIPGHGRLSDEADVVNYRDMVTIIRDRIEDMIQVGMTLEQVKTAKPTRDYDPLYGAETGSWTTEMFVEAAYRSLNQTAD